jgi:hypothetical protein
MGFLDNSGDIILDAVLTDTGRKRLAEGNGSFKITKYAFGDDEINYGNYDATNTSGSAYYDLQILQTPILEAFTNNTATMKSKLMTLTNNNILYLPVIVLAGNAQLSGPGGYALNNKIGSGSVVVPVDITTSNTFSGDADMGVYIDGVAPSSPTSQTVRCDQGLNTLEIPATYKLDAELQENQYIVEIDNRFGSITTNKGTSDQSFSFIDDDNVASYYLSTGGYVFSTKVKPLPGNDPDDLDDPNTALAGPRGTHLMFKIRASTNLRTSTYLFERLGSTFPFGANNFYSIDTIVRVTGATTGYRLDIPVKFVKQKS